MGQRSIGTFLPNSKGTTQMRRPFGRFSVFLLAVLLGTTAFIVQPVSPVSADTFTVTKTADTNDGACDNDCSLREALLAIRTTATPSDVINVPAGTYTLTLGSQLPDVRSQLTINGAGTGTTIIQAAATPNSATFRIFEVRSGAGLTLNGVTLRHGNCSNSLACTNQADQSERGHGGAIFTAGVLAINNSSIESNKSANDGGGIFIAQGTVTLTQVLLQSNSGGNGGGVSNKNGTLNVTSTTFADNSANAGAGLNNQGVTNIVSSVFTGNSAGGPSGSGGGLLNGKNATISRSTFSANTAARGGGLANGAGPMLISNSTIFNNSASSKGGGIWNFDNLTLKNNTISGNTGPSGGGLSSDPTQHVNSNGTFATVIVQNTIIANNTGVDCFNFKDGAVQNGPITGSNNIIETEDAGNPCTTNLSATQKVDPELGAATGSPAFFPLLAGSPAIDAGSNTVCSAAPVSNQSQNGLTRPQGPNCDIGSFEAEAAAADTTVPVVSAFVVPTPSSSRNIPIASFTATDNVGVTGFLITTSATPPTAGASGWTATAPTTFTVAADGTFTLFPWAKDAAGNVSAVFGSPRVVVVTSSSTGTPAVIMITTFCGSPSPNSLSGPNQCPPDTTKSPPQANIKLPQSLSEGVYLVAQFQSSGANRTVSFQVSKDQVTWGTVNTTTTDATGLARFFYRPSDNRYYRVVFAGAGDLGAAMSPVVRVVVRSLIFLRPTGCTSSSDPCVLSDVGDTVLFTAIARPNRPELPQQTVVFNIQRRSGSTWVNVVQQSVTVVNGEAKLNVTFSTAGLYRLRANLVPTSVNANSFPTPFEYYDVG